MPRKRKKKLTLFYANWCGGCAQLKPIVKKIAKAKGWKYKAVDVDHCPKKMDCDSIEYVPHVELDGKEIPLEKLGSLIDV